MTEEKLQPSLDEQIDTVYAGLLPEAREKIKASQREAKEAIAAQAEAAKQAPPGLKEILPCALCGTDPFVGELHDAQDIPHFGIHCITYGCLCISTPQNLVGEHADHIKRWNQQMSKVLCNG